MDDTEVNDAALRDRLRRTVFELKVELTELSESLGAVDKDAARAVREARLQMFEAWSILATPIEEEDDH